jgi:hypothetical protein
LGRGWVTTFGDRHISIDSSAANPPFDVKLNSPQRNAAPAAAMRGGAVGGLLSKSSSPRL